MNKLVVNLSSKAEDDIFNKIKVSFWIYFYLLIFEGALRKWVLPDLATPLLIIRDPVAIWIIYQAIKYHLFPINSYILISFLVTFLSIVTTLYLGHGNWIVALYGARIYFFHFPLIFIIQKVFKRDDIIKVGNILLYLSVPMVILIAVQFFSPQSAWVNRGIGGDMEGGGFSGALGYFRPPGTFSFISGLASFFGLVASFLFYFYNNISETRKWILILSTIALAVAIPLSISRTLFFGVFLSLAFQISLLALKPKNLFKFIGIVVVFFLVIFVLSNFEFFQTSVTAFIDRFTNADETEGGLKGTLIDRALGGMVNALFSQEKIPFWGYGLGMGTNAGAQILVGDSSVFLISEGEWGRILGEQGIFFGITLITIRLLITIKMVYYSFKKTRDESNKNLLSWFILSFALPLILQGQFAQPTALGFAVLSTGFVLAGLKDNKSLIILNPE